MQAKSPPPIPPQMGTITETSDGICMSKEDAIKLGKYILELEGSK